MSQDDFPKLGCVNHDCDKCQNYEPDNLICELEMENSLLRARNNRLQKTLDAIVPRLEAACGATSMPPLVIKKMIEEMQ